MIKSILLALLLITASCSQKNSEQVNNALSEFNSQNLDTLVNSQDSYNFGAILSTDAPVLKTYKFVNTSTTATAEAPMPSLTGDSAFTMFYQTGCSKPLIPQGVCQIRVAFNPYGKAAGTYHTTLKLGTLPLASQVLSVIINPSPNPSTYLNYYNENSVMINNFLDIGVIPLKKLSTTTIYIKNDGNNATTSSAVFSNSTQFTYINQCNNKRLDPGAKCKIVIYFDGTGKDPGQIYSTNISFGGKDLNAKIAISETGTASYNITLLDGASDITSTIQDMGTLSQSGSFSKVISIKNTGTLSSTLASPILSDSANFSISNNQCQNKVLSPNEICSFNVNFSAVGKAGVQSSLVSFLNKSLTIKTTVQADVITYSPIYSAYGSCSASQACDGVGNQARTITSCKKIINGVDSGIVDVSFCSAFNIPQNLQIACSSPSGSKTVAISNGSKIVSCSAASSVQNFISISCDSNFHADGQICATDLDTVSVSKLINNGSIVDINNTSAINCVESCTSQSYTYPKNSNVKLKAFPATGYKIVSWSGCPSVSSDLSTCDIPSLVGGKNISVLFSNQSYEVTLAYSDALLAQRVSPVSVYKNGNLCADGTCRKSFLTGDTVRIVVSPDALITTSFSQSGLGQVSNEVFSIPNEVSYKIVNSDVKTTINLQINGNTSNPAVVVGADPSTYTPDTPILSVLTSEASSIRCYQTEDVSRLFTAEPRLSIPSVIISQANPVSVDESNVSSNKPSYYGWIYVEQDNTIRECYDFSLNTSVNTEYVPSADPSYDPANTTSIRCYNSAGENSLNANTGHRTDIASVILSSATPSSIDEYNVNYRNASYKGYIDDNGDIKKCYEFSGELTSLGGTGGGNSPSFIQRAGNVIGTALGGTVSVLGDLGGIVVDNLPSTQELIRELNDFVDLTKKIPDIKLPNVGPVVKAVASGAGDLGEVLIKQIGDFKKLCGDDTTCIGTEGAQKALGDIAKTVLAIRIHGDGLGNSLESVYKKVEDAVPNVNLTKLLDGLKKIEPPTCLDCGIPVEVLSKVGEGIISVGASTVNAVVDNFPNIKVPSVSIGSFNLCSIIPHCTWKISYSCSCHKFGCGCSGSNHLSCTYSSSCSSLVPDSLPISPGGIVTTMKNAIQDVGNGVHAAVPVLVDSIVTIAQKGDEYGNTLEDLVGKVVDSCSANGGICNSNVLKLAENILAVGEAAREGIEDLSQVEISSHLADELSRSALDVAGDGLEVMADTLGKMGREIPKGLTLLDNPINELLQEVNGINWDAITPEVHFADDPAAAPVAGFQTAPSLGDNFYRKLSVHYNDATLAAQLKQVKVYKNSQPCGNLCINSLVTGDKIVMVIIPNEFVQLKSISGDGVLVKSIPMSVVPNGIMFTVGTADIVINIKLDPRAFLTAPSVTFIDTNTVSNTVYSSVDHVNIYTSNPQGATEMLISPSEDCSVGSYVPFQQFQNYNISSPNTLQPLSLRYKNGTKYSTCLSYKLYQDTVNTIVASSYSIMPSANCLLLDQCDPQPLSIQYSSNMLASKLTSVEVYKNDVLCDVACQSTLNVGDYIGVVITPPDSINVSSVMNNGAFLPITSSGDGLQLGFVTQVQSNGVNIFVTLDDSKFATQPIVSITPANSVQGNVINTTSSSLTIATSNPTVAQEILISNNADCSSPEISQYSSPLNYVLPQSYDNNISPLSIQYRNGSKLSACFSYTINNDTIRPVLSASLSSQYSNGSSITVSGSCESSLPVVINDGSIHQATCSENGYSYVSTVTSLTEGSQLINVSQIDLAGNISTASASYTLDLTKPSLTNNNSHLSTTGSSLILTGTCESGLPLVFEENGVVLTKTNGCASNVYAIAYVPSSDIGMHTIHLSQTDLAGNNQQISIDYERSLSASFYDGTKLLGKSIDLGTYIGIQVVTKTFTVKNEGMSAMPTDTALVSNMADFSINNGCVSKTLDIGGTCSIVVSFNSQNKTRGQKYSTVLSYSGKTLEVTASIQPVSHDYNLLFIDGTNEITTPNIDLGIFNQTDTKTKIITIKNNGIGPAPVDTAKLSNVTDFSLLNQCVNKILYAGNTCSVRVTFSGSGKDGLYNSKLTFGDKEVTFNAQATMVPVITYTPTFSSYGSCSASPCDEQGIKNRTIISCAKATNGVAGGNVALSYCDAYNNPTYLTQPCSSPAGNKTEVIDFGSREVYCPIGSSNKSVISVSCQAGYTQNGDICVEGAISYEPVYSSYGSCNAQACDGQGIQSKTLIGCNRLQGNLPPVSVDQSYCSAFNITAYLDSPCDSPEGNKTVAIDYGSQNVYCAIGSTTQVVQSVSCTTQNYEPNGNICSPVNCSLANSVGHGLSTIDHVTTVSGNLINGCSVASCDSGYDIDGATCRLTQYHIFAFAGGILTTGQYPGKATCADPDLDPRILQYSRGVNIGGLCPYTASPAGTFMQAINPLQFYGAAGFVDSQKVIVSSALRFAKRYLTTIHPNDKVVLLPLATGDNRYYVGTAIIPGSANYTRELGVINTAITHFGSAGIFKGIIFNAGESEYVSADTAVNVGSLNASVIQAFRNDIVNGAGQNTPVIMGSLCNSTLTNYSLGSVINDQIKAVNQYLNFSQYVSGLDLACQTGVVYQQDAFLTMGERFFNAFMNTSAFLPNIVTNPITDMNIDKAVAIANQASTGIAKITVTGGTPSYTFSTTSPNFSIIGDEIIANTLPLGTNDITVHVSDRNGVTFDKTFTITATDSNYSQSSIKTLGTSTYKIPQTSTNEYLNFSNSWTYSANIYIGSSYNISTVNLLSSVLESTLVKQGVYITLEGAKIKVNMQEDMTTVVPIANQPNRYGNYFSVNTWDALKLNSWNNVTVVYDTSIITRYNRVSMYINGIYKKDYSRYDHNSGATLSSINVSNSNDIYIFRTSSGSYGGWTGYIDDIGLWNVALNQADVNEIISKKDLLTHSKSGNLVHYYNMENTSDVNTIFDVGLSPMNIIKATPTAASYQNYVFAK